MAYSVMILFRFVLFFINALGTTWRPTDRLLAMQIHSVKTLLLWETQLLMKPPHAFGSHLEKRSDTGEVC